MSASKLVVLFSLIAVTTANKYIHEINGGVWANTAAMAKNIVDLCQRNGTVCVTDPANCANVTYTDQTNLTCKTIAIVTNYLDALQLANPDKFSKIDGNDDSKKALGVLLYGRYDDQIRANQSVAVALSAQKPNQSDILQVCTQDNVKMNQIFGSEWELNDKLAPNHVVSWPSGPPTEDMNLEGVQYFACLWGIGELNIKEPFPGFEFRVHLASVELTSLQDGGLTLKHWLQGGSVLQFDENYRTRIVKSVPNGVHCMREANIITLLIALVCNLHFAIHK